MFVGAVLLPPQPKEAQEPSAGQKGYGDDTFTSAIGACTRGCEAACADDDTLAFDQTVEEVIMGRKQGGEGKPSQQQPRSSTASSDGSSSNNVQHVDQVIERVKSNSTNASSSANGEDALLNAFDKVKKEWKMKLRTMESERRDLKLQLKELEQVSKELHEESEAERIDLKRQIEALESETMDIMSQLKACRSEKDELEDRIRQEKDEKFELKKELDEIKREKDGLEDFVSDLKGTYVVTCREANVVKKRRLLAGGLICTACLWDP